MATNETVIGISVLVINRRRQQWRDNRHLSIKRRLDILAASIRQTIVEASKPNNRHQLASIRAIEAPKKYRRDHFNRPYGVPSVDNDVWQTSNMTA